MTAVEKLKKAADEAYTLYPNSCSHSVWHVVKQYVPEQAYVTANALLMHLECSPRWKSVSVGELADLASQGILVVGGRADQPNGHVIVVYPGKAKMAGGYAFTQAGKTQTVRPRGPYALAMSTSLGRWPGAMSKGDKTVWDPWAKDSTFEKVKFWRFDPSVKSTTSTC